MTLVNLVTKVFAIGVVASQIFIVLTLVWFIFFRKEFKWPQKFFDKHGVLFAFIVALVATGGSLFYSLYAGYKPCDLCWYQRIFMYPQVILLGIALIKRDKKIIDYSLPLLIIGFLISLYQNFEIYSVPSSIVCTLGGSCFKQYTLEFGYIGIPMMAITAFVLISLTLLHVRNSNR